MEIPEILWRPTEEMKKNSGLAKYMFWLEAKKDLRFSEYHALWKWSTEEIEEFWSSLMDYFDIVTHSDYKNVVSTVTMPGAKWFEGATLSYSEHIFRSKNEEHPALIHSSETREVAEMSWAELEEKVAAVAAYLKEKGIGKGDRVAAFISNIPEALIAFLACNSLGAVWSSCSPDFGVDSILERFVQIEPKVLFAVNGYSYNGSIYAVEDIVDKICSELPSLNSVVSINFVETKSDFRTSVTEWNSILETDHGELTFTPVDFNEPIWILFSSGTTGNPKAITHSQGGMLLEHLKYLTFHNDVRRGERFYWYSTTGWMMWNFSIASLLVGATVVLFDGSAGYPSLRGLWKLCEKVGIHHFGTSAPFLVACMKRGIEPGKKFNLSTLRSIGSTGSPLPSDAFVYVEEKIKSNLWLCSMSGGTDVCTAFVGGNPLLNVYKGEIQSRALACALYAYDEAGERIVEQVGEMVIEKPMPCMPIYFWNDAGNRRYESAYFDMYSNKWRHGDWISISERGSLVIHGRSDATLNRQGVRIGTAEIYRSLNHISELKDALIVNIEKPDGSHFMPLFVQLKEGGTLNDALKKKINKSLRKDYTPRHIPDRIVAVEGIPYTISGKKMEAPVKKILMQLPLDKSINLDAMRNPECIDFYINYAKKI